MSPAAPRVVLVTESYPPYETAAAASMQRLAENLTHAGVPPVVFTFAHLSASAMTARTSDCPRVYRFSCVFEAFVLLDLEETVRPFDLLHAVGWPIALACLDAPTRNKLPLLVSLTEGEDETHRCASRVMDHATWIVSRTLDTHEGVTQRCRNGTSASVIAPEDGDGYAALYRRLTS